MLLGGFIIILVVTGIFGAIGQGLDRYSFGGCFVSIIFGLIGAWSGSYIALHYNLPWLFPLSFKGYEFSVVWSAIGAAIFSLVIGMFARLKKVEIRNVR